MKKYSVVINKRCTVSIQAENIKEAISSFNYLGIFIRYPELLSYLLEIKNEPRKGIKTYSYTFCGRKTATFDLTIEAIA